MLQFEELRLRLEGLLPDIEDLAHAVGIKQMLAETEELDARAAADGYTSLVIDGSKLSLEENIALARRVVEMTAAYPHRPAVEAELGRLGRKKDSLEVKHGDDLYTDPEEAARFVAETR